MSTWLASCLVILTLRSSINAIDRNDELCYKPVYCCADSSNCTLFHGQTAIFVCECLNNNCTTKWMSKNDVIKVVRGPEYTINVTEDIAGVMTCNNGSNNFKWNVTVLPSTKPKFLAPLKGHSFDSKVNYIGGGETCVICVNCSVTGDPEACVTWKSQTDGSVFNPVITNQTDPESRYSVCNNGQILCFNDIRHYNLVELIYYECTACNVVGCISATLTGIVKCLLADYYNRNECCYRTANLHCCKVALHQLPEPGPNMTAGPFNSRGHNVTLIMDTVYYEESTFRVCRYNRSSPKNLISCCDCYSSFCDWGELYSYNDVPDHYYSCKLKTSKVGRYQFQITTRNYPCYFNIGDPIDVNDSSDHIVYILVGCFGGLVLLLSVPIIGYCAHKKYRKYKMRHVANSSHVSEQHGVLRPLLSPRTTPTCDNRGTTLVENYGSSEGTAIVADGDTSATSPLTNHKVDNETSAGASIQSENVGDDDIIEPVPSTCKPLAYYHSVYIAYGSDSENWVINVLKPFLAELNVKVSTKSDAIPGQTQPAAHMHLINEANKIILVMSNESIKDHYFLYDMNKAMHKDPGPTKSTVIPILYENISPSDIPAEVVHLASVSNNDPELKIKVTKSIYS